MSRDGTPITNESVRAELARVLESSEFRASKRCQQFLSFVIGETLDGRSESLKERTIGVELLGQAPDYDAGLNASVRVRANEVRKRLRQYYTDPERVTDLRIELPAGSYVPEFHPVAREAPDVPTPDSSIRSWRASYFWFALAAVVILAGGFAARMHFGRAPSMLERFWEPARHGGRPMLLCMDYARAYHVSREFGPDDTIAGREIVANNDGLVGAGGIHAISAITAMLTRMGVEIEIRIGPDTSFGDLRHSPVVVMGCYNNRWAPLMYEELRFGFSTQHDVAQVEERKPPHRKWVAQTPMTYGVLSRVFHPTTGGLVIGIAGISHNGTRAVAEFATNASLLAGALADAPADWEKKNLQIVLRSQVIANTPAPAKVMAVEFW